MKSFLRSKLVLTLVAFLMIVSAIAVPLVSSSISHSRAHAANSNTNSASVPFNTVNATFYNNPNDSGTVDFNTATHGVFAQTFPNINFNPPDSPNCAPQGVDTRPFTDVVQNADGSCTPIIAQSLDKTEQAGVNDLLMFETKFVATINVPSAGKLTSTILADDGWIFCMENETHPAAKPTPDPGNIMAHPVTVCPGLASLPEMGDNNIKTAPTTNTITMNLPTAGEYGVEIDYTECCQGQLTLNVSNSFTPTQTHNQLFVLLQGINTGLTASEANDNSGLGKIPDFWNTVGNTPGIAPFLMNNNYGNAKFLSYSYSASNPADGHPFPYDCLDTFDNTLDTDVVKLNNQITDYLQAQPKDTTTDIYLIGHSLGGVVAFAYLTAMLKAPQLVTPLPSNANLAGVITLDSPVGGVSSNKAFLDQVFFLINRKPLGVKYFGGCNLLTDKNQMISVKDLANLFDTTSKPTFPPTDDGNPGSQGAHASMLKAIFGGNALTNQGLAEIAAAQRISVLTIGNTNDFLYQPGACPFGAQVEYKSSQWIGDEGPFDGAKDNHPSLTVYGRKFTAGSDCGLRDDPINHKAIYNNDTVETGLLQFLSGKAPNALVIAPPEP